VTAQCPSCRREQAQGLLCWEDSEALMTMFAAIPQLVDELQVAIGQQAKLSTQSGASGKGSAHTKSPINFGALAVRDALMIEAAMWAHEDIDDLRKHPQVADIVREVGAAVKAAYRAIDRMADRKYLGKCYHEADGHACEAELWARPGANQVTCASCKYVHDVGDRRADMMDMAEDLIVTVKQASSYMGEYGHVNVSESNIRNWLARKHIITRPGPTDEIHFRMGDLMDLLRRKLAA
jgi:hypothetical protein